MPSIVDSRGFLKLHHSLLSDWLRTETYRRAIFKTVKKGDVVLDLGSGTGILAFLACQAGARRVYAMEAKKTIEIAKCLSFNNGFQDRVAFLEGCSNRLDLPERVDVVLTETVGNFGSDEGFLGYVMDARRRFLKKGGSIVPQWIELFIVPAEFHPAYRRLTFWSNNLYGVDFSVVRTFATNTLRQVQLVRGGFLSQPASLGRMHLLELQSPDISEEVCFIAKRSGVLHGIGGWFTTGLCKNLTLSTAPPNRARSWGNVFFPLGRPIRLKKNDRFKVRISSSNNGFVWNWQVECGGVRVGHSSLFGFPLPKSTSVRQKGGGSFW